MQYILCEIKTLLKRTDARVFNSYSDSNALFRLLIARRVPPAALLCANNGLHADAAARATASSGGAWRLTATRAQCQHATSTLELLAGRAIAAPPPRRQPLAVRSHSNTQFWILISIKTRTITAPRAHLLNMYMYMYVSHGEESHDNENKQRGALFAMICDPILFRQRAHVKSLSLCLLWPE